jgi:NTE family protein
MGFSLSLSGGGARGAAHVGVLKALEEEGLKPDALSGTSAGAIVAALYAYGISVGELEEWVYWLAKHGRRYVDVDFLGLLKLMLQVIYKKEITISGIIKGRRLERLICDVTEDCQIEDIPEKLIIPAVDLYTGRTVVFSNQIPMAEHVDKMIQWENKGRLCKIVRASASVPGVFQPVEFKAFYLVDGGVTQNLPVDLLTAIGEQNILAVDVGASYKKPQSNSILEVLTHSFEIMGNVLKECTSEKEKYLLKTELPDSAGLLSFDYMPECMRLSYEDTKKKMPQIKQALKI